MTNIVVAGVGGQGSIFAAKILGSLYMARGFDVKVNEVHGMAQRGGSIVTMVKAAETVYSPLVKPGTADYLIGMELSEAVRALSYLKPDAKAFMSERIIPIAGQSGYDPRPTAEAAVGCSVTLLDAHGIAKEAGNARCENAVLLGMFSKEVDFTKEEWEASIRANVKPDLVEVNLKAFEMGAAL
jgi:indolepyruvate ferredoxin oxidoreductase beta subunit